MADPTIQSFCCHHRNHSDFAFRLMNEFHREPYLIISMISSSIGMLGSIYQIFIRKEEIVESPRRSMGRKIIVALAYSDLLASLGIFIRSALWCFMKEIMPLDDDSVSVIFCSVTSAMIQVFYTATWLWTLIYAYNMKRSLTNQSMREKNFHVFVWSISILFTAIGTSSLYFPDADCHDIHDLGTALLRVMPNYLLNYGTILVVMIVNPILYIKCSKEVDRQLIQRYGEYTNNERQIHDMFKIKFSLINLIFYICWLPNIVNAILMWTMWFHLPAKVIVITWYIMAVLNPLQAFFNVLVYRKWNNKIQFFCSFKEYLIRKFRNENIVDAHSSSQDEISPLLHNNPISSTYTFSRNNSQRNADDNFRRFSIQCPCV
ncbi:CLUMA_CG002563, isoform A [Clunio marinus]|uniref:CLUMA_CG002563, isoform A n=1 Tax=Clunio marinus TaxID=568069 RepID=A0A1J1HQG8_9DIPT|nr:CLUMA_CG002563, isoform A [Clunio marinus]